MILWMAYAKVGQIFLLISIINTIKILSNDFIFVLYYTEEKKTLTIMRCVYYSCVINKRKKTILNNKRCGRKKTLNIGIKQRNNDFEM
jgi:hypothetical protein